MMSRLGSLLAKPRLTRLQRSTICHSTKHRLFSAQAAPAVPLDHPLETDTRSKAHQNSIASRIRVLSRQNVKPDKPTPDNLQSYKLSAFDQVNIPSYVPFIFFYRNDGNGDRRATTDDIDNVVFQRSKLLKRSLSETLTLFYPFAGKYIDDRHIECNDEGVYYIETQIDGDLASFITKPNYRLLQGLLPMPPNTDEPTRGFYLSMIQVNFFTCGGIAISMCNSHKLIDGSTYMTFVNAWASTARGAGISHPNFDSSSLFLPNTKAPTYPSFPLSSLAVWPALLRKGKCSTKRFVFDSSAVDAIKAQASSSATRVVSITSLIWKCATMAARNRHGEERPSLLQMAVNLRSKFSPPLPPNAIGNIIWTTVAKCEESNSGLRLDTMVRHINDGISRIDSGFAEQFKGKKGSAKVIDELKRLGHELSSYEADYYSFSSMCRSGAYEADFGWGRPVWSCYANFGNDVPLYANVIILMDRSNGDGIEAWVTLSQEEMELFENDPEIRSYASVEPSPYPSAG